MVTNSVTKLLIAKINAFGHITRKQGTIKVEAFSSFYHELFKATGNAGLIVFCMKHGIKLNENSCQKLLSNPQEFQQEVLELITARHYSDAPHLDYNVMLSGHHEENT